MKGKVRPRTGCEGEGEKRCRSTLSLTTALDGVGSYLHTSVTLPPGKRPGTHFIVGWVGPRTSHDGCGKSRPHRDSILGSAASSESLYRLSYPGPPLHYQRKIISYNAIKYFCSCSYRITTNITFYKFIR